MNEASAAAIGGPLLRRLKARGALLEPSVFVGKAGLSPEFLRSLGHELDTKELVKVKFVAFKEEKKELVNQLVEATASILVMRVGNVAVLYRRHPEPERRQYEEPPPTATQQPEP